MTASPHFVLRFLSRLLKSLWLFFPGILFLLLTVFFFWLLGQGKDIIVAFTENRSRTIFSINYTRIIFFLAIGFWVYVSWYSSRIIAYIKKSKEQDKVQEITGIDRKAAENVFKARTNYFEISSGFLEVVPRLIGHACFLVLELAVLQSPVLMSPINSTVALIIFFVALFLLYFLNRWIQNTQASKPNFRRLFWILLIAFLVLLIAVSLFTRISILALLGLLVLFHAVFIFYINLRWVEMEKKGAAIKAQKETAKEQPSKPVMFLYKLMDYFCVPVKEKGYFKWYLIIGITGVLFYIIAINSLSFARGIGPFPFIILAFGVLLAFGNIVTAFSVRFAINFHFLLFVLAFVLGMGETHYVRTIDLEQTSNNYDQRPSLQTYLTTWLSNRNVLEDSTKNGYDVYFVMANGGASRSGYWTAGVLGKIEDSSLVTNSSNRFSDHVFCLSGTSGGGVGVATFFSLLRHKEQKTKPIYNESARAFLKQDYFTFTVARMLGPDFFNYIFHLSNAGDRAAALEKSFEESAREMDSTYYGVPFYEQLSNFPAVVNDRVHLPILCVNTTRMQDGNPGLVSNLKLDADLFNNRVDVLQLLKMDKDISLTSGSILGARFPYLSPAGRIGNNYFVDGGYFDNSGAGVVQEMIRGIINIGRQDSITYGPNSALYKSISKLHFKVLHIVNSPVDLDSSNIKKVAPIKNDLLAPILTIIGAYDMQTTVNDARLINFIKDINNFSINRADYTLISLYDDAEEWKRNPLNKRFKKDPPYAMNWFMSDTTLHRINKRLNANRKLDSLIESMKP